MFSSLEIFSLRRHFFPSLLFYSIRWIGSIRSRYSHTNTHRHTHTDIHGMPAFHTNHCLLVVWSIHGVVVCVVCVYWRRSFVVNQNHVNHLHWQFHSFRNTKVIHSTQYQEFLQFNSFGNVAMCYFRYTHTIRMACPRKKRERTSGSPKATQRNREKKAYKSQLSNGKTQSFSGATNTN